MSGLGGFWYNRDMSQVLEQIDRMTQEERLQTLDHLWMRIIQSGGDMPAPAWHERELRATEARIASGESKFIPWEDAKEQIRASLA